MPKRQTNSRSYSNRKLDIREVKERFLIVCEGKKTEPYYFRSFRVPKAVVAVQGAAGDPSRLVNSAHKLANEDEYDQVWCVFDRDIGAWTAQNFKLLDSYNPIDPERDNPATTVHLLVQSLNRFL